MRQTIGVLLVAAVFLIVGLAVRWLAGSGRRGRGSGRAMDPFEHNADAAGDEYQRP